MDEVGIIRVQYHRLEAEFRELRARLALEEAARARAEANLADALDALAVIAGGAPNAITLASETRAAIERRSEQGWVEPDE